ncbi:vitamin K epoxide reductase [Pseudonocardia sp. N23]|nr:vitamin K epoxide reductase [Pseudonocardia sp. N23]
MALVPRTEGSATHQLADPFPRLLPWMLTTGGATGLLASTVLTVERANVLSDADYIPSCNLGSVLSCGSVMRSPQAALFGFPNSLLGIMGFAIVLTVGVAILGGARFRSWFWAGLQLGVAAGVGLVHVLMVITLYRIGALCPYCMVVWAVTVPVFWYVTLGNLARTRSDDRDRGPVAFLLRYHSVPVLLWTITVAVLVLARFWSEWTGSAGVR